MNPTKLTKADFQKDEIKWGRIDHPEYGRVGYAAFLDPQIDEVVELISIPYGGLYVQIAGKVYPPGKNPNPGYSMIWARVAGWLGNADFARQYLGG